MNLKSLLARPFANHIYKKTIKESFSALQDQESIFKELIKIGRKTIFGNDHQFNNINTYNDFTQAVPIRDYEQIKSYINQIKEGKHNV